MLFHAGPKGQCWYGESIGILILDAHYPCVPGNVGNATTFPFPVRYKVVKDASIERLLTQRDPSLVEPFIRAALELQQEGVKAITGACGFMALFQREVSTACRIPVFLSSLLQVPFILQMLPKGRRVGVITANSRALTPGHLNSVGITPEMPLAIGGMEAHTEFREAVLEERGSLDSDLIRDEVVTVARKMVSDFPDLGAILLECSDLPPYASAVQAETHLPVFDFITMIHYVHSAFARKPYEGFM